MAFNGIVNKEIGKALAKARKKKGLIQEQMAEKLRFTPRQYQNYEAGEFPMYKTEVVKEIDKILGTHFYELIYATNEIKAPSSFKMTDERAYIKVLITAVAELQTKDDPKKSEDEYRADMARQAKVLLGRIPNFLFLFLIF